MHMKGYVRIASALAVAMLMFTLLNGSLIPVEGEPQRAPDKYGRITTDETWSGPVTFYDVTVENGVTVTIRAGSELEPYTDAYFHVLGNIVVEGSDSNPVSIGKASGNTWKGIIVRNRGMARMENFSISNSDDWALKIGGKPSTIKNGDLIKNDKGLVFNTSTSGHTAMNMRIGKIDSIGLGFEDESHHITVDNITISDSSSGFIVDLRSNNLTLRDVECVNNVVGAQFWNTKELDLHNIHIRSTGTNYGDTGMVFLGECQNTHMTGLTVEDCEYGLVPATTENSHIYIWESRIADTVNTSVYNPSDTNEVFLKFINSQILSRNEILDIVSDDQEMRVMFMNCTWNDEADINLRENATFIIGWHLNMFVHDAAGSPLNTQLEVRPTGAMFPMVQFAPDGVIHEFQVSERLLKGSYRPVLFNYDLRTTALDYPGNIMDWESVHFDRFTELDVTLDLMPNNTFSSELEFDEDESLELNLSDHFNDPENLTISYDVETSGDLSYSMEEGNLTLMSSEDNWNGVGWVNVSATDTGGNQTYGNATVTVNPVNDPPALSESLPMLACEEDGYAWINLSNYITDVEDDPLEFTFEEGENYTVQYNATTWNLTVTPVENYNGMIEVPFTVDDGTDPVGFLLMVNVTPVNDPPMATVRWPNGTEVLRVNYPYNETTNLTVYEIFTDEDTPVDFWVDATDIDTEELEYSFVEDDLVHGTIEVETVVVQVFNETSNVTENVTVPVPMNFSYIPDENDHTGDLVMFHVSDGEETINMWIWFNVTPVNDPPLFGAPDGWNVTVETDEERSIDIGDWISDVDGDDLTISVDPSDYVSVNGTEIVILYNDTFEGDRQNITVTVSDGEYDVSSVLTVHLEIEGGPGPGPGDEWSVSDVDASGDADGWTVTASGEEGQTVYVCVEDEEGNRTYYRMTYSDGNYEAFIPAEDAAENFNYFITDSEGGESLVEGGALPTISGTDDGKDDVDEFPWWIVVIVLALLIVGVVLLLFIGRGAGGDVDLEE